MHDLLLQGLEDLFAVLRHYICNVIFSNQLCIVHRRVYYKVKSIELHTPSIFIVVENSTCSILESPPNSYRAYIYGTPGEIGSVIQFSCHKQSKLIGQHILTCQDDGTWNQPPPTCISKFILVIKEDWAVVCIQLLFTTQFQNNQDSLQNL